ncbi:MAG: substrate-binding domain-containing protein [Nitrospiraceae bacterium]
MSQSLCRDQTTPTACVSPWGRRFIATSRFLAEILVSLTLCLTFPLGASAEVAGNLIIAGNGPEQVTMETLARAFEKINPRAYIDILWDNNSKPLEQVKTGHAHIAVTGAENPALAATQIGWDGIGFLVHLSNFTKEVTKQQVADIFSGKVQTWSELGGPDTRILLIDRPRNQNIREAFEAHLGIAGQIPKTAKMIGGDEKVVKTVVGTLPPLSAVAYVSLSTGLSVVSSGVAVRLLPLDKVEPEVPTVKDGRYGLRRPLLLLSKKEPQPLVDAFAQFALSAQGQSIIGDIYIPMPNR